MTLTDEIGPFDVADLLSDGRQSPAALDIQRGVGRLLRSLGWASVFELPLANGRRADVVALSDRGDFWIIEIKSCLEDFRADHKWQDYRDFSDQLYFAVAPGFPVDVLPPDAGLILADRWGGEIMRASPEMRLVGARRKAMTLRFAHCAAARLLLACDPDIVLARDPRGV